LDYKIKLIKFDKIAYENNGALIPIEILESSNLTSTG
jgi:hypothetical protein